MEFRDFIKEEDEDFGGIQPWSKGEHHPWVIVVQGSGPGLVYAQHPDGRTGTKFPFEEFGTDFRQAHQMAEREAKSLPKYLSKENLEWCHASK